MNKPTTRWGIFGPGKISEKFALDLAKVDGGHLQAVASRSVDRAKEFAGRHGASLGFGDYDEMLRSGNVDIVYIGTPHTLHFEHTMLCLEYNVPVLCEKPFAMNTRQVDAMINKARHANTFLMEALWSRFMPSMMKVLEIIDSGEMGEVEQVEAEFSFKAPFDPNSRLYDMSLGGGSILDIGIYPVFLAYLLLGVPESIEASGSLSSTGSDQSCSIQFAYPDKKSAALFSSFMFDSNMPARITCSKGYILIQPRWFESEQLTIIKAGYDPYNIDCPKIGKGYAHEIIECHDCLAEGRIESEQWSHQDSINLISLLDEIRRQVGVTYQEDTTSS